RTVPRAGRALTDAASVGAVGEPVGDHPPALRRCLAAGEHAGMAARRHFEALFATADHTQNFAGGTDTDDAVAGAAQCQQVLGDLAKIHPPFADPDAAAGETVGDNHLLDHFAHHGTGVVHH